MSKSKKVWVADDDESIRFVLEKGLIDAGFEVSVFEDGNEVVNQLDLEKPNVLLTDLKMPGRDGMDLLDTFKNEFSNIGRSIHSLAVNATNKFDETRISVKNFINANSKEEIIFTKNAIL